MSFPKYAHYKDSGVEWLGEVPAHWVVNSLGRIATERCDGPFGSGITSDHYTESGAQVVRLQNIKAAGYHHGEPAFIDLGYFEESLFRHGVEPDDLLIAGLGDENNLVGRACVAPQGISPALVKADCFRFRLNRKVASPGFIAFQLCVSAECDGGRISTGSTRSRIPLSMMASRKVALPALEEQYEILSFLTRETTKLDALITEQRTLIDLLKEKLQAVISHAVTKGLDPGVPMKDSGVEWLGEVPAHWEVVRVRHAVTIDNSPRFPINREERAEMAGQYPYWGPTGVIDHIDHFRYEGARALIGEDGDHFTKHSIWPMTQWATGQFNVNNHAHVIADGPKCLARWFYFSFLHRDIGSDLIAQGVSRLKLTREGLSNLWLAVPPLDEQIATTSHLEATIERQSEITKTAQLQISLLEERRSALISAAVTGKIDVRHVHQPEPA